MDDGARVAIITGGSSGIGLACGHLLAAHGYRVILTARREGPLRDAAASIDAACPGSIEVEWVAGDSSDAGDFAAVTDAAGSVDLLVHAAGMMAGTFVRKETLETFDAVIRANLRSAFVVASTTLPVMPAGGRIVFLSSSSASVPQPGKAAYSASKAGLNAFAAALAGEVDRDGIAVHVVSTGPVATPMLDDVHFPMLTLAADDVAHTVLWLDQLPPNVRLPEVAIDSVARGPFAPVAFVPAAARALGRTELP